ncbi:nuclear receptor-binding factor 2 [Galendromus occidentalis]|uniref:Nuclear receptor-binding factor 2 n=1 Tax=Galendromus occidentalis TaxID=34638 RepID=A0AAJ6QSP9_9ACAR|nr:nuclear receptor-binding factor 2 [Galendromus occidentalis]
MELQLDCEVHIDLAHRERRRADRLLQSHRFDEAISAHQDAITQLEKVLAFAKDPVVNESIQLQIAFHNRQQLIVACRREKQRSLLKRQASVSYCRETGEVIEIAEMALPDQTDQDQDETNTTKMHMLFNQNADLLQQLYRKSKDSKSQNSDCQVIDELRANNTELRKMLGHLASDNCALRRRNRELRDEIEFLRSKLNQVEQPRLVIPELAPLERPDFDA